VVKKNQNLVAEMKCYVTSGYLENLEKGFEKLDELVREMQSWNDVQKAVVEECVGMK
jgi:hypothetical protein